MAGRKDHRGAAVDKLTRELGRLSREAAHHGWLAPDDATTLDTVDRAA